MFKDQLQSLIGDAIVAVTASAEAVSLVHLERPRLTAHGDLACSVAKIHNGLQPAAKMSVLDLAHSLADEIARQPLYREGYIEAVQVSEPGFLGFKIGPEMAAASLARIIQNWQHSSTLIDSSAVVTSAHSEPDSDNFAKISDYRARSLALLNQAQKLRIDILTAVAVPALFDGAQWEQLRSDWCYDQAIFLPLFRGEPEALPLTLTLSFFSDYIKLAGGGRTSYSCVQNAQLTKPQGRRLRRYLLHLSEELEAYRLHFNPDQGFFSADLSVLKARLGLIFATTRVLTNGLGIIQESVI